MLAQSSQLWARTLEDQQMMLKSKATAWRMEKGFGFSILEKDGFGTFERLK